jgi:hypothetical protein
VRPALWIVALVCCVAGACSRKGSNTKIMVVVWSDLTVPTELNQIHIDVKGPSTATSRSFSLAPISEAGKSQLPVVYELVSPDDEALAFDVVATGYADASLVVSQSAHVSFDPGHSRVLALFLSRACEQVACAGNKTCSGGSCVDVDADNIPEYDPKSPWVAPDAGGVGMGDAGDVGRRPSEVGAEPSADAAPRTDTSAAVDLLVETAADVPLDGPSDPASDPGARLDVAVEVRDAVSLAESGPDLPLVDVTPDVAIPDVPTDRATAEASSDGLTGVCNAASNTETDPANCGACGQACSASNGVPACAGGRCSMAACLPGYLDCSGDENTSRNGCETHGAVDPNNCGRCKNACTSMVCREGACLATALYGNTGPGVSSVNFTGNYLAGIQVYVPNASVVTGLGVVLFGATTGRTMYLGLYSDVAGNPATLLATLAGPVAVSGGGQEFDVSPSPVDIGKGNYWILGVWDGTASFASNTGTTVTWRYASRSMGPLPETAPTSMASTPLAPPNLYIRVAQ